MARFVRIYTHDDGVTYTCSGDCEVRGPHLELREFFDWDQVDCPSCLPLMPEPVEGTIAPEVVDPPCPRCGESMGAGTEERIWLHVGKFYCSEACVRKAERL